MTKKEYIESREKRKMEKITLKEKAKEQAKELTECEHDYKMLPDTYRTGQGGMKIVTKNKACKKCGDYQSYEDNRSI